VKGGERGPAWGPGYAPVASLRSAPSAPPGPHAAE
jgi:hypothetical protein